MNSPQHRQPVPQPSHSWVRRLAFRTVAVRVVLISTCWWIISEGQLAALVAGIPAVLAATALSLALAPPARYFPRPLGFVLFLGFFLRRSVAAGIDVAWRILQPVPRYHPVISRVPLCLPEGGPRWLLATCLSLLPGTLSVAIEGDVLVLHRLDDDCRDAADVRDVERRIARMLHLQLEIPQ